MTSIAVIDHGAGNLVSMTQAIRRVGGSPEIVDTARDLDAYDGVVLPGVGATGAAMRTLTRTGLADAIRSHRGPLLGVCVGMQVLFEWSDEDDTRCLGLLPGRVRRIRATPLPHMGWNSVASPAGGGDRDPTYYFVHSFAPEPTDRAIVTGTTTYGSDTFASTVSQGPITAVQFHPERSGQEGLEVIRTFVERCEGARDAA